MKRIKIYIVTYNNDEVLKKNLESLYLSDVIKYDYQVHVINNYGRLSGFQGYPNFEVLDNVLRPDFSNGHLSRNWNQALMHGFKDLNNPDSDLVILMQNDTFVKKHCFSNLVKQHEKYDFIQIGAGDQFMSFNCDAVKHIGLFDERFNSIAYQEADYFMTARVFHGEKVSINDWKHHYREHNPIVDVFENYIEEIHHLNDEFHSWNWHKYNNDLFYSKWRCDPMNWHTISVFPTEPKISKFFFYPYFEKDIIDLTKHKYNHSL